MLPASCGGPCYRSDPDQVGYSMKFTSTQTDWDFGLHTSSYDGPGMSIMNYIEKTGTVDITNLTGQLSGANPEAFTLALDSDNAWVTTLYADRYWNDFRVYPNNGLSNGKYTATVTFTADHGVSLSFNVSFGVS